MAQTSCSQRALAVVDKRTHTADSSEVQSNSMGGKTALDRSPSQVGKPGKGHGVSEVEENKGPAQPLINAPAPSPHTRMSEARKPLIWEIFRACRAYAVILPALIRRCMGNWLPAAAVTCPWQACPPRAGVDASPTQNMEHHSMYSQQGRGQGVTGTGSRGASRVARLITGLGV